MDNYEEDYRAAIREVQRLRSVVRDYEHHIAVFDTMVDGMCELYGVYETIEKLIKCDADRDMLMQMNFSQDDIEYAFDEINRENTQDLTGEEYCER